MYMYVYINVLLQSAIIITLVVYNCILPKECADCIAQII